MAAPLPGRFKTFKQEETKLAQDFLAARLVVGDVLAGVAFETENSRRVARENPSAGYWDRYPWMLKADLVVETPTEVWIVGLSMKGRASELGQLLIYRSLYEEQYRPTKPIRLAFVARRDAPEIRAEMARQGIAYFVVPEA